MARFDGYGQYCPIAIAAEVLAERWSPLVIRSLCLGATRFNEIHGSVPRMSTALLSRRLGELEAAGIVERRPLARGSAYHLTPAGRELFPVLEAMGFWAQTWLRREITRAENLDPYVLMWELRRAARMARRSISRRRVVQFHLEGVPADRRRYWLVFEPDDADICTRDPGYEVDLWITAHIRTLVEVWLGHRSLENAIHHESLRLDGDPVERAALREWFSLSHFAKMYDAARDDDDPVNRREIG